MASSLADLVLPFSKPGSESRISRRIARAFEREERAGLKRAAVGRLVALAVVALWVGLTSIYPEGYYVLGFLGLFAGIGLAQLALSRQLARRHWINYLFVTLDVALLTVLLLTPNPFEAYDWPRPLALRLDNFVFFFVLLIGTLLSYAPGLVLWFGVVCAICWGLGVGWIAALPETLTWVDYPRVEPPDLGLELAFFLQPQFLDVENRLKEILVVLIVATLLAVAVRRLRHLVLRQAEAERQRGNLARYFSPNMVDQLAASDEPLGQVKRQEVAVLFADMVGFTALSERLAPEAVIELLRDFHERMSQAVFDHDGTVDKFIGDAIMATFGTPGAGPRDAANALACALAMVEAAAAMGRQGSAIEIGIGVHVGPAVLGDIGSARRLEYAVVGDTVNVASRLEALTRDLKARVVISEDLAQRAEAEGAGELLARFRQDAPQRLRNRAEPLAIRSLRQVDA